MSTTTPITASIDSSNNGSESSAYRGHSGLQSTSQEAAQGSFEDRGPESGTKEDSGFGNAPASQDECPTRFDKDGSSGMTGSSKAEYQRLLNREVRRAANPTGSDDDDEQLAPSQVGASYWTSSEKQRLFSALVSRGRDDLLAIASTISTKSEPEVRAYLLLLQPSQRGSAVETPQDWTLADSPPALEIGNVCEQALDQAAVYLAGSVYRHDVDLEQKTYGKHWLIDEGLANEIERAREESDPTSAAEMVFDGRVAEEDVQDRNNTPTEDDHHSDKDIKPRQSSQGLLETAMSFSSAELLRPHSFLDLSRTLFMNSGREEVDSWYTLSSSQGTWNCGPAIFRSAFDIIHKLTIDTTQRLAQAAHFQAMTRLRARDDSQPAAVVTERDVRVACDLLGFCSETETRRKYWASVADRCGVSVYSDAERFKQDGRPGTKTGVKLTRAEVQAELGFPDALHASSDGGDNVRQTVEQEVESETGSPRSKRSGSKDDDRYRSQASSGHSDSEGFSTSSHSEMDLSSTSSAEDEEDQYLESIDQQASQAEQYRLLKLLGHKILPPMKAEEKIKRLKRLFDERETNQWRKRIKYAADWEENTSTT